MEMICQVCTSFLGNIIFFRHLKVCQGIFILNSDLPGMPITASNENDCQSKCKQNDGCNKFTYQKSTSNCWLKHNQGTVVTNRPDLISGPKNCNCFDENTDYYGGDLPSMPISASSANDCQAKCQQTNGCNKFTYQKSIGNCFLKENQGTVVADRPDLVSGPKNCPAAGGNDCFEDGVDFTGPRLGLAYQTEKYVENPSECMQFCCDYWITEYIGGWSKFSVLFSL